MEYGLFIITVIILFTICLIFSLILIKWFYEDALKSRMSSYQWILLILLTGWFGFILYFNRRKNEGISNQTTNLSIDDKIQNLKENHFRKYIFGQ
jgi:hypothetical protein